MSAATPSRQSILLLGSFVSHTTGYRNVCEELADRLERAGWEVRRASRHTAPLRKLGEMLHAVWAFRASYAVAQIDVFSGRAFLWARACGLLLHALGKPFVLTLHGGNLPQYAQRHPRRVAALLARAACVTAPSVFLRDALRGFRDDILVIPNPVDVSRHAGRQRAKASPSIIWVRSIHRIYDPLLAVDACALLAREYPDLQLWMLGPDKQDGTLPLLLARIAERGMAERVTLVGGVAKEHIPGWLDKADIFLNTTTIDNTPVSVIEAMASGLCIVSTNVGGIPHLLTDGQDALLVPPGSADDMAASLRRILQNTELCAALSRSALETAASYTDGSVLDHWQALLGDILARRTTP